MPGDLNYLDLQLNGYRGVDFNARELRIPSCRAACKALQAAGVVGVLATIITDDLDSMWRDWKGSPPSGGKIP